VIDGRLGVYVEEYSCMKVTMGSVSRTKGGSYYVVKQRGRPLISKDSAASISCGLRRSERAGTSAGGPPPAPPDGGWAAAGGVRPHQSQATESTVRAIGRQRDTPTFGFG